MPELKLPYFTFYITKEFEPIWDRFIELYTPEVQRLYEDKMKKQEIELKDIKGANNKNYKHRKNTFISMALRRGIKKLVDAKQHQLLKNAEEDKS